MSDVVPYGVTKRQRRVVLIAFSVAVAFCLLTAVVVMLDFFTNKNEGDRYGDIFALCLAVAVLIFMVIQLVNLRRRIRELNAAP